MYVAASTECFNHLPLKDALERLTDLEFTSVEVALHEHGAQIRPSDVAADLTRTIDICRNTRRLDIVAYSVDIAATGDEYYRQFEAICRLAKATKVVTITVPSGELGTPFNEEVERLRRLVDIATLEGIRVGMRSQVGCLTEDPDTVTVLCDNVNGLGLTLDPSHYTFGRERNYDKLLKYVYHVHLRDTTKDKLQVRVGQGAIEYGRLIACLRKVGYNRVLSINITEMEDVDHMAELRKMRLLLESLL